MMQHRTRPSLKSQNPCSCARGPCRCRPQGLAKDLEEQREALTAQHEQQKDLYATIKGES